MRRETCCFTGHRNLPAEHLPAIPSLLDDTVAELIGRGIVDFACGGARGIVSPRPTRVLTSRTATAPAECRSATAVWSMKAPGASAG